MTDSYAERKTPESDKKSKSRSRSASPDDQGGIQFITSYGEEEPGGAATVAVAAPPPAPKLSGPSVATCRPPRRSRSSSYSRRRPRFSSHHRYGLSSQMAVKVVSLLMLVWP